MIKFIWLHTILVGASLLAIGECQALSMLLNHRYREQARSHRGLA
ncbi:hypothetical protein DOCECA_01960 [Pseudomonas sp. E102]